MNRIRQDNQGKSLIAGWFELGALIGCALLAAVFLYSGYRLGTYQSAQIRLYNQGLSLYKEAQTNPMKVDEAILAFDQSLDDYSASQERSLIDSLIYPERSDEIAALALSKKAVLYLLKNNAKEAIRAFKESISLNSGQIDPDLIAVTISGDLSQEDIARLSAQAQVSIHNLEMLFGKKPSLRQSQGKGQGKGKGYNPEPAPGSKPSPGAGRSSNPNAI